MKLIITWPCLHSKKIIPGTSWKPNWLEEGWKHRVIKGEGAVSLLEGQSSACQGSGSDSRGGADFLLGGLEGCITIEKGAPGEGNEQVLSKVLNAIQCEISVTTQG